MEFPPDTLFLPVGYNPTPEADHSKSKKHFIRYYPYGMEKVKNDKGEMVIEKTYKGRSSEYTTQSIYIGVNDIDNDSINNVVFMGGEICDESGDMSDIDTAAGKFILSSGPSININMNEKSDKRRMISI